MAFSPCSGAARDHVDRIFESASLGANRTDVVRGRDCNYRRGLWYGRGYDIYARLVAAHLGNHLPGKPYVVVQNVPGAASVKAAMLVYNKAPKDGTTLGLFLSALTVNGVLNGAEQHSPEKFT